MLAINLSLFLSGVRIWNIYATCASLLFVVFFLSSLILLFSQVIVRNVPPDPDESVSEHVEHFFCVNHPDHYLTHRVCTIIKSLHNYDFLTDEGISIY